MGFSTSPAILQMIIVIAISVIASIVFLMAKYHAAPYVIQNTVNELVLTRSFHELLKY